MLTTGTVYDKNITPIQ